MTQESSIDVRPLARNDAEALRHFYNGLSVTTIRTFRPLGLKTSLEVCRRIATESASETRWDLLAWRESSVAAWAFVHPLAPDHFDLGICVADSFQNRGIGTTLLTGILAVAEGQRISPLYLMVVKDNARAIRWYERHGFTICGEEFDEQDELDYFHMAKH